MHGKQPPRAQKRAHQNNTSSSEYSSASSQQRSDATESDNSPDNNHYENENDQHPDGYPTSDDDSQHHHPPSHPDSTARKGPMHASYARANRPSPTPDGDSTQSDSENDQDHPHDDGTPRHPHSPNNYDDNDDNGDHHEHDDEHDDEPDNENEHDDAEDAEDDDDNDDDDDDEDEDDEDDDDEDGDDDGVDGDDDDVVKENDDNHYYQHNGHPRSRHHDHHHNQRTTNIEYAVNPADYNNPHDDPYRPPSNYYRYNSSRTAAYNRSPIAGLSASPPRSTSPRRRRTKRVTKSSAQIEVERAAAVTEIWGSYEPVVVRASQLCDRLAAEPASIAYARLVGAGKAALDYCVRMRCITIGRSGFGADCEIRSETRSVSRSHAKLYWDTSHDHWMVSCLSAKNGMVVDGAPIAPYGDPVAVKSRSLVEIGDVSFFFLAATEATFRVNDVNLLEQTIFYARERIEQMHAKMNAMLTARDPHESTRKAGRNGKISSKADRSSGAKGRKDGAKKIRGSGRKGGKTGSPRKGSYDHPEESSSTESSSSSESEPEDEFTFDLLDDPKYKLPLMNPSESRKGKRRHGQEKSETSGRKRRKKGKSYEEEEGSTYEDEGYELEWSKKEKTDFTRALFAVGVDAEYDENKNITGFDWSRFRYIAEFPKKSDVMLEEYYRRVMLDVREMLDEEEREKKAKGPRTKHKQGCECNICENARKARRKRREELGVDERDGAASEEDAEARASSRGKDRLVGLVTAQKLRVRIGIHEAARQVDREPGYNVFTKLQVQQSGEVKEMPAWWRPGFHDRELMQGCQWHGVGQWTDIWFDDSLGLFVDERKDRDPVDWPTQQATMKRVRDLASSIISEMKRIAKRDALEERARRRDERRAARRSERRRAASQNENENGKRKRAAPSRSRNVGSGDEYDEDVPEAQGKQDGRNDGESTVDESGSDRGGRHGNARQARQDDGAATEDEEEVEMEVEEEMDIEPEYEYYEEYQGSQERESEGEERGGRGSEPQGHGASTEDEEEGNGEGYGTLSDSGGE